MIVIPDIVKEQVWEIVAQRFKEAGARVLCGGIYGGDVRFEYVLPDGMRGRCELRDVDYELALNSLADKVFPNDRKITGRP